jgi:hypothetical protein
MRVKKARAIGVAAVLALTILGSSCQSDDEDAGKRISRDVQSRFLASCNTWAGTPQKCQCVLERLVEVYSGPQFAQVEESLEESPGVPKKVASAIKECT